MNIISLLLKWLWKWEKGSKRRSLGGSLDPQRHLGAKEKSMLDDVRTFLQEIRMQDKLPDILRQRNISVEEFKGLEDLRQLYLRAKDGSPNAARELNERYSNDPVLYSEEMNLYNRIKEQMHDDADDFLTSPEQKQKKKEEFDAVGNEIIAEQEQISNIQRRWSELAMEDVPQTDERTEALERVRNMMGNARRISDDREWLMGRRGITPSQARTMADATQWISRTNEELDSIRSGDYRNWADRHSEPEPPRPDPMSMEHNFGSEDEIRFARRMNRENPMSQEEIDNIMRERRRRGLPPYGGEGDSTPETSWATWQRRGLPPYGGEGE